MPVTINDIELVDGSPEAPDPPAAQPAPSPEDTSPAATFEALLQRHAERRARLRAH